MSFLNSKQKSALALDYLFFKNSIIHSGYADELDWQHRLCINKVSEKDILKEYAWVVLSSGMNYKVINKLFDRFSEAFYFWDEAKIISKNAEKCKRKAMKVFANEKKLDAIIYYCNEVSNIGFQKMKDKIVCNGISYIQSFPYMGVATSYHYAKNIGLDVVKPDRHLVRISAKLGFQNPSELCSIVSSETADKLSVIDLVYWRYATLNKNYLDKMNILH